MSWLMQQPSKPGPRGSHGKYAHMPSTGREAGLFRKDDTERRSDAIELLSGVLTYTERTRSLRIALACNSLTVHIDRLAQ
mmetsp:Transcript_3995/g.8516  ORF Transcript_3995/g.8516 Transcript_3995/m.8516 type:complete len:80 (-) Transcript_3995:808-1047(-)